MRTHNTLFRTQYWPLSVSWFAVKFLLCTPRTFIDDLSCLFTAHCLTHLVRDCKLAWLSDCLAQTLNTEPPFPTLDKWIGEDVSDDNLTNSSCYVLNSLFVSFCNLPLTPQLAVVLSWVYACGLWCCIYQFGLNPAEHLDAGEEMQLSPRMWHVKQTVSRWRVASLSLTISHQITSHEGV